MKWSKKDISDVINAEKDRYFLEQLTTDYGDYTLSIRSRTTFQELVHNTSTIPLYLTIDWVSLHPGGKIVTKIRLGEYVDEAWLAARKLMTLNPKYTWTLCNDYTGPITFDHFAFHCRGMDRDRSRVLSIAQEFMSNHNVDLRDLMYQTARFQSICDESYSDSPRNYIYRDTIILKSLQFAQAIDQCVERVLKRKEYFEKKLTSQLPKR